MNLMLTMLLGGLWHGAAWTFVVWGGLHGAVPGGRAAASAHSGGPAGRGVAPPGRFALAAPGDLRGWCA